MWDATGWQNFHPTWKIGASANFAGGNPPGCVAALGHECVDLGISWQGGGWCGHVPASPGEDVRPLCSQWGCGRKPPGCLPSRPATRQPVRQPRCVVTHTGGLPPAGSGADGAMLRRASRLPASGTYEPAFQAGCRQAGSRAARRPIHRTQFRAVCANHRPQAISEPSANRIYRRLENAPR